MKRAKQVESEDAYGAEDDLAESDDVSDPDLKFEKMDIDTQMKKRRLRTEPEDDDWFGSDFSCCFCVPIKLGVKLIGFWWVVNFLALIW